MSRGAKRSSVEAFGDGNDTKSGRPSQNPNGHRRQTSTAAATHLATRQKLPIWAHQDAIRSALRTHNVLLLVGETGSGKSTQVPQFLINEPWCRRRKVTIPHLPGGLNSTSPTPPAAPRQIQIGGTIAITQPRRVAATSLARRVAEEMGTGPLGSKHSEVGYSVRFDNQTGPATRIKYLTEGMLLQELLRDPGLRAYSVVVVDEVHERGVDVDLCLGFLRGLCDEGSEVCRTERGGVGLRVVVMSATAEMGVLEGFFAPKQEQEEDVWEGFSDEEDSAGSRLESTHTESQPSNSAISVTTLQIPGRLFPVEINYLPKPTTDVITSALERITDIHVHRPLPGDILVFLPGQENIETLHSLLKTYASNLNQSATEPPKPQTNGHAAPSRAPRKPTTAHPKLPHLLPLPLYASLPTHQQSLAIQNAPEPFTRKVILATNIAETSLTIPGIQYVIDSGFCKQRLYRPTLGIESLIITAISKSSAKQRAGRAGRERKGGVVWRMYTEKDYHSLEASTAEEITRADLRSVMLVLKSRGVTDDGSSNSNDDEVDVDGEGVEGSRKQDPWKWVTPPKLKAWRAAMIGLFQIGALDPPTGMITDIGRELSLLPLPVSLGKCLLSSTAYGTTPQIIDIVSALSVEGIFFNISTEQYDTNGNKRFKRGTNNDEDHDEEDVLDPRLRLRQQLHRREGDHLTLLATVQAYVAENTDRKRWCNDRGTSHRAMQGIMDVRKQLTGIMNRKVAEQSQQEKRDRTSNGHAGAASDNVSATDAPSVNGSNGTTTTDADLTRRILTTLLCGLHPNVARLSTASTTSSSSTNRKASSSSAGGPQSTYTTLITNQPISIHPSSVLFGRKVEAIMSSEMVFTTKSYARCVSAVEMGWVGEAAGVGR
ncbi:putative ATP-dependent RNA helicase prh1 [Cyphellophora attinorum]|uniref:RNA helicase n=1 Tax=Cyphellophora attinorum TaxID=1664694 RepID=A0A0N0NM69_9EURO|nr:putative ATP-dependent RNA helicase prh1 [Phialophora attinorum]KPI40008.1 putative ATP-dependent RNA helicase prh1 [Phialophora attinorum]